MSGIELKTTEHRYYCSDNNYYVGNYQGENYGRCDYDTWEDFKKSWLDENLTIDHDYNHCFRFDIVNRTDEETDEEIKNKFSLKLYFLLQRKGIFRPVYVSEITEDDLSEIEQYLNQCWDYLKNQWIEFQ